MTGPVHEQGHQGLWVEVTADIYDTPAGYGPAGENRPDERTQQLIEHVVAREAERLKRDGGRVTGVRAWLDGQEIYREGTPHEPQPPAQPGLFEVAS